MKSFLESFRRRKIDEAFENPLPSWIKDSYRSDKFVIDEIVKALKTIYSNEGIATAEKASWNRFANTSPDNFKFNKFKIDISKVKFIEEEIPDNKNAFNKMLKDPKRLNILLVELYYTPDKPITYYPFIFTAYQAFNDVYLADTDRASDTAGYRGRKWLKKYNDNSVASDSIEKYKYLSAIPIKDLYEMAVKYCYIDISDATAYLENNREKYVPSAEDNRHKYKQKMQLTWDEENNYNPKYIPSFTKTGNYRIPRTYSSITTDKSGYELPNIRDRIAKAKSMGFNPSKLNTTYSKLLKLQQDIQDFENKHSKLPSREFTKSMTADEVRDFLSSTKFSKTNNLQNAKSYLESAVNYFKLAAQNLQSFIEDGNDADYRSHYITRIDDYLKECESYIKYAYKNLDVTDD